MEAMEMQEDICYVILLSPTEHDRRDMEIIRAASREEAVRIAERDPYVTSGIRSYELRTWGLSHAGNRHMGIAAE
ncbi:YciI family protein [Paenibacillus camerounensis]|uniref:YciI family protein n=1 Tax=Paenibacillus camerounensis TaxID=1243663 RepID=UPI0005A72F5C|nr:YciI family protein [Paenibacillus camerounensis]